jgi:hypothetical protein
MKKMKKAQKRGDSGVQCPPPRVPKWKSWLKPWGSSANIDPAASPTLTAATRELEEPPCRITHTKLRLLLQVLLTR